MITIWKREPVVRTAPGQTFDFTAFSKHKNSIRALPLCRPFFNDRRGHWKLTRRCDNWSKWIYRLGCFWRTCNRTQQGGLADLVLNWHEMAGLGGTGFFLLCILGLAVIIGFLFLVLAYLVSINKLKSPFDKPSKVIVEAISVALFASLALAMAVGLYEKADKNGWFAHERTLAVEMPRSWLVGEYKACVLAGNLKVSVLSCAVDAAPHVMNVEFRGSLGPLESETASNWVCQRAERAITCRNLVSHTADKRSGPDY